MLYCENCMRVCSDNECPSCRRNRLRFAKSDDIVFLISENNMWSGTIEDILRKNNIPYLKKISGFYIYIGFDNEDYDFFVPFYAYQKARDILDNFIQDDKN